MTSPVLLEDYRVELDAYAGPLDLLLYLVRRHEIDLHDIPIAKLTEQYLEHLKLIEQIDVDLAGEFLVMAATLLEIKSAMLLPAPDQAEAGRSEGGAGSEAGGGEKGANPLDPRYELVRQLLAYKRFKDAANNLEARRAEWDARFARQPGRSAAAVSSAEPPGADEPAELPAIDLDEVNVLDLCEAFARLLDSIGDRAGHKVVYDDTPLALHAEDILDRLRRETLPGGAGRDASRGGRRAMTLQEIFVGRATRGEMIGLFLATLELVRQKKVRVAQERPGGEIRLELSPGQEGEAVPPEDERTADWRDPATGEMQYEWPSEAARRAAERRAKLRAHYAAKRQAGAAAAPADPAGGQAMEAAAPDEEIVDLDGDGDLDEALAEPADDAAPEEREPE